MADITLKVTAREKSGSAVVERSRKQGLIPAVMYGHGLAAETFWVRYIDFSKMYEKAGESSIVSLTPEKGKAANVIVHDVQLDPLTNRFSHVDFFQVRMDEALETHVPLEFIGEAPAVRELGGILVKPLEELFISCLPKDLPHSITVDLTLLKTFEDHLSAKDLKMPAGVTMLTDELAAVVLVEAPRTEAEMASLDEKVEGDVTKVEGVVKEEETAAAAPATDDKKAEEKKEDKK